MSRFWFGVLTWVLVAVDQASAQPSGGTRRLRIVETKKVEEAFQCQAGAALLNDAAGQLVGCEFWEGTDQKIVQLRSGARFQVEPLNATLVSSDGKTLLKFGDFANLLRRPDKPSGWIVYGGDGKVLASRDRLDPNAVVAMSSDGYFAIATRYGGDPRREEGTLSLYSPAGQELFSKSIGTGAFATQIAVRQGAQAIAVAISDVERFRNGTSSLALFGRSGERIGGSFDSRWVNTLAFVGVDGAQLLVCARDSLALVGAADGKLQWKIDEHYRLAGPGSLGLSADGNYLHVVTVELTPERRDTYVWRAHLISMATGERLSQVDLPGVHPMARTQVITRTLDGGFGLATPEKDIITIGVE